MKFVSPFLLGVIFCLFISSEVKAQVFIPDSLQQKNNREKAIFLNERAKTEKNLDTILLVTKEAASYASQCDCDSILNASYYHLAFYPVIRSEYDLALKNLEVLDSVLRINKDEYYLFRRHTLSAYAYKMKDQLEIALDSYKKALDVSFQLKDSLFIADAYNNLGDAFVSMDLNAEAKEYFLLAISIFEKKEGLENRKYITYNNLSKASSDKEEIRSYSDKAFEMIKENKEPYQLSVFYITRASAFRAGKHYTEAKEPALRAYQKADSLNYDYVTNISLIFLGEISLNLGEVNAAINYLEKAQSFEQDNPQNHKLLLDNLALAYAQNQDYNKAFTVARNAQKISDSLHTLINSEKFAEFDVKFKTAQKDKEIAQQQLEIATQKNKRNQWIFGSLAALLIAFGLFQWYTNRQKRKKMAVESELQKEQEINDLRSKFLGNIAHEIRTPLTLISGNLNLALENFESKEKAKRNIEIALENSEKVTQDANEILELLKFEKNKTTINKVPVHLENTIKRMVLSFSSLAEMKHVNLTYHASISPNYKTELDLEKTEKIINNLISNAIKYSSSNSDISVTAAMHDEMLRLDVTDFGPGIQLDEKEKIFERFYQSKTNQAVGGIGIGLSLSKEFAELLNGQLYVTSELDKGSTFTLTLPVPNMEKSAAITKPHKQVVQSVPSAEAKLESKGTIHKPKILITEDHPQMAAYLEEILSESYHCTLAFDGNEALQKMKNESFDLITSDIMMPKLDGFQFRERLNENPAFRTIPFILISAKTLEDDKIRGFKLGIDDYIVKPFNKNELIARIDNLLTRKKSREAWQLQNESLISDTESSDQKLLKTIENLVIENISNEHFKIKELAEGVNYSQRQLTRIMKQYCGMTPVQFILEIRLLKAYQLLQHQSFFTLSEVRYDVGISSSSYFNKKFKERFGVNPSELLQ